MMMSARSPPGGHVLPGGCRRRGGEEGPGNDNFANAYTMTGWRGRGASGSNVGATAEGRRAGGSTPQHRLVEVDRTADRSGDLRHLWIGLDGCPPPCVYSGSSLTGLYNLGCDDDGGLGLSSAFRAPVNKGSTYYLQVDGYGSHVGSIVARARFAMCNGVPATIDMAVDGQNGTPGDDVIAGTEGPDVIDGSGGNDMICAYKGNDTPAAVPGNDGDHRAGTGQRHRQWWDRDDTPKYSDGKAFHHVQPSRTPRSSSPADRAATVPLAWRTSSAPAHRTSSMGRPETTP